MTKTEKYVRNNLTIVLEEVQRTPIAHIENGLTIYEKTLIYHYTKDGYRPINRSLRRSQGRRGTIASDLLDAALGKLPDWRGWPTGMHI